jgi:hypothetical protein
MAIAMVWYRPIRTILWSGRSVDRWPEASRCPARSLILFILSAPLWAQQVAVPFVGCKSDGQAGPIDAPVSTSKAVPISGSAAQRLAYYKAANGFGVLAPRDWYCFGTYGSAGASLYVSPEPIDRAALFSANWTGFTGPAIQISLSDGGTSGRFQVARVIARVFPAHRAFAYRVIAEGIEDASAIPFGPWPADKLTYRNDEIVEFQTPANTEGLGTNSRLNKNSGPINGVAILTGPEIGLLQLSVLLPEDLGDLTPTIIQQAEHEAPLLH